MPASVLITGVAGNLGGFLARHLHGSGIELRLMVHRRPLPQDIGSGPHIRIFRADLASPATLVDPCRGSDAVVHFAGVLFAPRPERFLPVTNTQYAHYLVDAAIEAGVRRFILVSFPHVEGPTTPDDPARGRLDASPTSVHARTRLEAERYLLRASEGTAMEPVVLRCGTIYGRGVLMVEAARRLLGVWHRPTWYHFLSLPDFLSAMDAAIRAPGIRGVYLLGDEAPMTLQAFLDRLADHWGLPRPWRAPAWAFFWRLRSWRRGRLPSARRRRLHGISSVSGWSPTSWIRPACAASCCPSCVIRRLWKGLRPLRSCGGLCHPEP
ncbi:MAG: NAD(P)-dependent oxidoreductase, partial [Chloroflexota bacterium]